MDVPVRSLASYGVDSPKLRTRTGSRRSSGARERSAAGEACVRLSFRWRALRPCQGGETPGRDSAPPHKLLLEEHHSPIREEAQQKPEEPQRLVPVHGPRAFSSQESVVQQLVRMWRMAPTWSFRGLYSTSWLPRVPTATAPGPNLKQQIPQQQPHANVPWPRGHPHDSQGSPY